MPGPHTEDKFEAAIEAELLADGWLKGTPQNYRPELGLDTAELFTFVGATQAGQWTKLLGYYGNDPDIAQAKFAQRVAAEIDQRGTLDVLRQGVTDHGVKFRLAYFAPASAITPELVELYEANRLTVTRQLRYSAASSDELDLALFVNGLPTATAELKNALTGQTVEDAKKQYRNDRDPKELIFARRALAHFAVDTDLVYMTTRLAGARTRFLPFNVGSSGPGVSGGAGNPTASEDGYRTSYLWRRVWQRNNWLDLLRRFLHVEDPAIASNKGRKTTGRVPWHQRSLIFPRFHQWHAVRELVAHAAEHGAGHNYLIEHSAGSGKSNTIAWTAHRLASLHDASNQKVFAKVIVITDRVVLDRQLQDTIFQFDHTVGVVEKIDKDSAQLAAALQGQSAQVIITTLQKFPYVLDQVDKLAGSRFAVIVDEAHSSQTGETAKALKQVLAEGADAELSADGDAVLVAAEVAAAIEEKTDGEQDPLTSSALARGRHANLSFFAFTATPKHKTLELFGTPVVEASKTEMRPFHVYSMRQAIEEGFILDVLRNYVTYKTYYKLTRIDAVEGQDVDKRKAAAQLARFASLHPSNMTQRAEIIVEHFRAHTMTRMGGRAKAMVVTRSRVHAVRTYDAIRDYIKAKGYPGLQALVAFSGTVTDAGSEYTEASLNGFSEAQLPEKFAYTAVDDPNAGTPGAAQDVEYHVLVVAEKYQTGFDQPLLTTMYVDKKLEGVKAVQTLSRLNRTHPLKSQDDVFVLDFANEAADIAEAFKPWYETTIAEPTDPNLLYNAQTEVMSAGLLDDAEMTAYTDALLSAPQAGQHAALYKHVDPARDRFTTLLAEDAETAEQFRGALRSYTRMYAFLAQVIPFHDAELERLYLYGKALLTRLPRAQDGGVDIGNVDLSHLRITKTGEQNVSLTPGGAIQVEGFTGGGVGPQALPQKAPLQTVIDALNDRLGGILTDADKLWVQQSFEFAAEDDGIAAAAKVNTEENFGYVFDSQFQDLVLTRHDQNAELIARVFADTETTDFFTRLARKAVWEMARETSEQPDSNSA